MSWTSPNILPSQESREKSVSDSCANAVQGIQDIAREDGALLCFDEVMTGFRIAKGCAQEYFGITPDLTTLGKVIGGGLPVGAYGGRADIMKMVAPSGPMYQVYIPTPTRQPAHFSCSYVGEDQVLARHAQMQSCL